VIRFLVSGLVAAVALFATLYAMSRAIDPGSPGDVLIVGQLELLVPGEPAKPSEDR